MAIVAIDGRKLHSDVIAPGLPVAVVRISASDDLIKQFEHEDSMEYMRQLLEKLRSGKDGEPGGQVRLHIK